MINNKRDDNAKSGCKRAGKTSTNFSPRSTDMTSKCFYIKTFGCQMNFRDAEIIAGLMKQAGFELAVSPDKADVVIYETCSVREHAEERVLGQIRVLAPRMSNDKCQISNEKRNTRDAIRNTPIIVLASCMAQNYQAEIFNKLPQVDIVCGPGNIFELPNLVKMALSGDTHILACDKQRDETADLSLRANPVKAFVNIMEGCDNFCSYCVVPYVRGRQKSRRMEDIIAEITRLGETGYKEVTLLGQNVNSYTANDKLQMTNDELKDKNSDFVKLLEEINKIKGIERIRFVSSHPKDAKKDLFLAMRDLDKVCESLHLPIQSGSDRILKLMNRKYTAKHFRTLIDELRGIVPDVGLSTDIIVGFPGETEDDFKDTYNLVNEMGFDNVFVFKYSPRPKTKAAQLNDDVPRVVKEERNQIVLDLAKNSALKKSEALKGSTQETLVECLSEKHSQCVIGRTRSDRTVLFKGDKTLIGRLVKVKITANTLYTLHGEIQ